MEQLLRRGRIRDTKVFAATRRAASIASRRAELDLRLIRGRRHVNPKRPENKVQRGRQRRGVLREHARVVHARKREEADEGAIDDVIVRRFDALAKAM